MLKPQLLQDHISSLLQHVSYQQKNITCCCSAAAFQPTLDKAGNAVGSTVSGRQWHDQKLASRIQGWQNCLQKYMSKDHRQEDAGQPADPCFLGDATDNTALHVLSSVIW